MATIDFQKIPQNKFYSYLPDGHIYNIESSQPTVIAADGGVF